MYQGILGHGGRRYAWWAAFLIVTSFAVYWTQAASEPPSGGTWQGYGLGGLGVLLILWLSWLGIRKRSYRRASGTLRGWVSAHVYLGLTLPVIATLHCAFQFGLNIHTLAYALMMAVILSGAYGLFVYLRFPNRLVANREDQSRDDLLAELDSLDQTALDAAGQCDDGVYGAVCSALEMSTVGGSFMDQLLARDRSRARLPERGLVDNAQQRAVIDHLVERIPDTSRGGEAENLRALLRVFGRRAELLKRLRRELSLELRLKLWLVFHVPLTFALLAALIAHVVAVFFYW